MKNALSPQAARLSPRLAAVLSCVEKCGVLADIGTDHAYLPIEAVRAGLCERAIACDVSVGPLEFAARNIRAAGLCDETFCNEADDNSWQTYGLIETRLGDGLAPLAADKADCIVIAGMGGMKIIEILQAEKKRAKRAVGTTGAVSEANVSRATGGMCRRRRILSKPCSISRSKKNESASDTRRLIFQPQHDLEELRRFLHANGRIIMEEKLAREGARFYVIIVATGCATASEGRPSASATARPCVRGGKIKKRAKRAVGTGGTCHGRRIPSKPGAVSQSIKPYTDAEYFLGRIDSPDAADYYREMRRKILAYFNEITDENAQKLAQKRLAWLAWIEERIGDGANNNANSGSNN